MTLTCLVTTQWRFIRKNTVIWPVSSAALICKVTGFAFCSEFWRRVSLYPFASRQVLLFYLTYVMKSSFFIPFYKGCPRNWTKLRESIPYVKVYRYNPKHLYPKMNGYGDNGHRKVWAPGVSTYCTPSVTPCSSSAHARQRDTAS